MLITLVLGHKLSPAQNFAVSASPLIRGSGSHPVTRFLPTREAAGTTRNDTSQGKGTLVPESNGPSSPVTTRPRNNEDSGRLLTQLWGSCCWLVFLRQKAAGAARPLVPFKGDQAMKRQVSHRMLRVQAKRREVFKVDLVLMMYRLREQATQPGLYSSLESAGLSIFQG